MTQPQDQAARLRFATELDRNFSVVASAGSGKTRAVTERIVQLAKSPAALDALPRLVVLTFANRAADERSEEHTSELQSRQYLVCRLLLEKKKHTAHVATNRLLR